MGSSSSEPIELAPDKLLGQAGPACDFHIFESWEPNALRLCVGKLCVTRTRTDLRRDWKWIFDHPFFLLINLAVGGGWPGARPGKPFLQNMQVNSLRV